MYAVVKFDVHRNLQRHLAVLSANSAVFLFYDYVLPHQRLWTFDVLVCPLSVTERFLLQPLVCGTVFHHTSLLPPLSPSSAVVLNHISSHFLITLSDSSLICTVSGLWLAILIAGITGSNPFRNFGNFKFLNTVIKTVTYTAHKRLKDVATIWVLTAVKKHQNAFAVGAPPQTRYGSLQVTTLPRPPS